MKHTSFYIFNDSDWINIKMSILRSGMETRKFLWEAAKSFSKKRKVEETGTLMEYMGDMEKPEPNDVFSIGCWNKYMSDKKSFKKVNNFHNKLDDLIHEKAKIFG